MILLLKNCEISILLEVKYSLSEICLWLLKTVDLTLGLPSRTRIIVKCSFVSTEARKREN